jgi:hypothetical protein
MCFKPSEIRPQINLNHVEVNIFFDVQVHITLI